MIARAVHIEREDWTVYVFADTDRKDAEYILHVMYRHGATERQMQIARRNLRDRWKINTGMTATFPRTRISVTVISESSSIREFINTYEHELNHLKMHVSKACHYDPYGEAISKLSGELSSRILLQLFAD